MASKSNLAYSYLLWIHLLFSVVDGFSLFDDDPVNVMPFLLAREEQARIAAAAATTTKATLGTSGGENNNYNSRNHNNDSNNGGGGRFLEKQGPISGCDQLVSMLETDVSGDVQVEEYRYDPNNIDCQCIEGGSGRLLATCTFCNICTADGECAEHTNVYEIDNEGYLDTTQSCLNFYSGSASLQSTLFCSLSQWNSVTNVYDYSATITNTNAGAGAGAGAGVGGEVQECPIVEFRPCATENNAARIYMDCNVGTIRDQCIENQEYSNPHAPDTIFAIFNDDTNCAYECDEFVSDLERPWNEDEYKVASYFFEEGYLDCTCQITNPIKQSRSSSCQYTCDLCTPKNDNDNGDEICAKRSNNMEVDAAGYIDSWAECIVYTKGRSETVCTTAIWSSNVGRFECTTTIDGEPCEICEYRDCPGKDYEHFYSKCGDTVIDRCVDDYVISNPYGRDTPWVILNDNVVCAKDVVFGGEVEEEEEDSSEDSGSNVFVESGATVNRKLSIWSYLWMSTLLAVLSIV